MGNYLMKNSLKNLLKKIMAVFYRKNGLPGEETIREMTVESIQRLNMPIIKDELLKNSVVMEDIDIWHMTYEIMQALHNNDGVYSEQELRKKTQEYITKGLYKNFIRYAHSKEIDEAMPIVDDVLKEYKFILEKESLRIITKDVISLLYAKGGSYSEETIRVMTVETIQRLSIPIIKDELLKNSVVMEDRGIWYMTYEIMQVLRNNGRDYATPELRKKTQEYITKGLYKNYIGRAGSF
jgi:hypothetical protein